MTLLDFQNRPKTVGYEMIPISQFKINFDSEIREKLQLTSDSKIIVFRFNKQMCRILLVQSKRCSNLLYVIGYDWNYTAYNHG